MKNCERDIKPQMLDYEKPFDGIENLHIQPNELTKIRSDAFFVLLLGPSAIGKSSLIKSLNEQTGNTFTYISPYTTRPLRDNEKDKISINDQEFDKLEQSGKFIYVNNFYNARYGTPLNTIEESLKNHKIPILDFPLDKVEKLIRPEYDLLNIYIFPKTINSWLSKVKSTNRDNSGRVEAGLEELTNLFLAKTPNKDIHCSIVSDYNLEKSTQKLLTIIDTVRNKK